MAEVRSVDVGSLEVRDVAGTKVSLATTWTVPTVTAVSTSYEVDPYVTKSALHGLMEEWVLNRFQFVDITKD